MAFVCFLILGAAVVALTEGDVLAAIGLVAFVCVVVAASAAGPPSGGGRWFVGFGWGRVGRR